MCCSYHQQLAISRLKAVTLKRKTLVFAHGDLPVNISGYISDLYKIEHRKLGFTHLD